MPAVIRPYRNVWPKIDPTAFVAETATVIGDVVIGPESGVWYGCTVRGDVNEIRIGARTNIQDGTVIHVARAGQGTYIGDEVTIGHMALLHACTLEDNCFIGMKACVMDGAVVEAGAMVAAGALVTPGKRVSAGWLWAGSPARPVRPLTDQDRVFFPINVTNYVELGREHRQTTEET
ncbi:MAG TPA: gamma carbonic anhydrase family protein [Azospirillum sp.]|nr:gamma carbonic anhydrase family protein [Azospirillum sp.]